MTVRQRILPWRQRIGALFFRPAMPSRNHSIWLRYGIALLVTAAALALKALLVPLLTKDQPVLLFFAAVMVAAGFGGFGPGLAATVLAAISDMVYFMPPFGRFQLYSVDERDRLVVFIAEGIFISIICARMKAARRSAEESAAEAHELQRRLMEVSDAEQRRIGHDLHDGLGQHLTGIALMAKHLEEILAADHLPASQEAARICTLAKSAVEWTRDLCHTLSSPTLELDGLPAALGELASQSTNIFRIECSFVEIGAAESIDLSRAAHLYRIAQEAIINAVRHGHAGHVLLRLEYGGGFVTLQIIDDGTGIAPGVQSVDGMGLKLMRYRARMIGGSMDIAARDSGGTVVTCRRVPLGERMQTETLWKQNPQQPPHARLVSSWSKITPSSAKD
jgi:signal transduction histidine kinase